MKIISVEWIDPLQNAIGFSLHMSAYKNVQIAWIKCIIEFIVGIYLSALALGCSPAWETGSEFMRGVAAELMGVGSRVRVPNVLVGPRLSGVGVLWDTGGGGGWGRLAVRDTVRGNVGTGGLVVKGGERRPANPNRLTWGNINSKSHQWHNESLHTYEGRMCWQNSQMTFR